MTTRARCAGRAVSRTTASRTVTHVPSVPQGPADVEPLLREEVVEVVPRHPAWDPGKALAHLIGVAVAKLAQGGIDLAATPAGSDDRLELAGRGGADRQAGPVVEEHVQALDVVRGPPADDRMHPAGVVADHP